MTMPAPIEIPYGETALTWYRCPACKWDTVYAPTERDQFEALVVYVKHWKETHATEGLDSIE